MIDLTICPSCNARLRSKQWIPGDDNVESIKESIVEHVDIDPEINSPKILVEFDLVDKHKTEADIVCEFQYMDLPVIEQYKSEVRIKYEQCTTCSRMAAAYFNAIIQIRAEDRSLTDLEADNCFAVIEAEVERVQRLDRTVFVSKLEEIHGGYDLYLSSQNAARQIVKLLQQNFGGELNTSSSLIGQKDGKEVYRMTYLFRLPKYQLGDIIRVDDRIAVVRKITERRTELIELKSWNTFHMEQKKIKGMKILAGKDEYRKGQIIVILENEMQLLDLNTYKTLEVLLPLDYLPEDLKVGDEVDYFVLDDDIYLIPEVK